MSCRGPRWTCHASEPIVFDRSVRVVRIRMKSFGRRHRPFFRICAMDSRSPRDGRSIEELGHYDPMVRNTGRADGAERQPHPLLAVGRRPAEREGAGALEQARREEARAGRALGASRAPAAPAPAASAGRGRLRRPAAAPRDPERCGPGRDVRAAASHRRADAVPGPLRRLPEPEHPEAGDRPGSWSRSSAGTSATGPRGSTSRSTIGRSAAAPGWS